jgi:hypothetical protein
MQFSQLTDWQKGDRFLAAHMQEGVAAIREVRRSLGGGTGAESNLLLKEWRLGVTADPPSGSSQYTDPRYWVKWSYVDTGTNVDSVAKPAAITFPTMTTDDGRTQYPLEPSPVTVTNLAELTVSSGTTDGTGTHSLAVGTPVLCVALYDAADQYGVQRKRWVMDVGGGAGFFDAKITAHAQDGSNKRWSYTFSEVEKTSSGYGGWTVKSGGMAGTAYNRTETRTAAAARSATESRPPICRAPRHSPPRPMT